MTTAPQEQNFTEQDVYDILENELGTLIDHVIDDLAVTGDEINIILSKLNQMGLEITPELRQIVERYLKQELQEEKARQKAEEDKEQQEESESQTQAAEEARQEAEKLKAVRKSQAMQSVIKGLANISGLTRIARQEQISPSATPQGQISSSTREL